jgi:hypothetical protein
LPVIEHVPLENLLIVAAHPCMTGLKLWH